ncbi:hypothetical protein HETIRDRAFT_115196 [Heterobasidion irregulare TC 32-1]|uniref:Uncharacterized protein n=1 Tax=Heterobasidion irregulare (strain TC 32-1) TaxID=747525 RepID=W4KJV6_HETIT|nr:uncharacterized protein HETIRDRAFT_115196 [Heterobasidion irregulare TC 32-1]ETW85610.1 hypothetical protein HETIRDRAFT_115196 [Heterobasidion irregulare TC 32-1]
MAEEQALAEEAVQVIIAKYEAKKAEAMQAATTYRLAEENHQWHWKALVEAIFNGSLDPKQGNCQLAKLESEFTFPNPLFLCSPFPSATVSFSCPNLSTDSSYPDPSANDLELVSVNNALDQMSMGLVATTALTNVKGSEEGIREALRKYQTVLDKVPKTPTITKHDTRSSTPLALEVVLVLCLALRATSSISVLAQAECCLFGLSWSKMELAKYVWVWKPIQHFPTTTHTILAPSHPCSSAVPTLPDSSHLSFVIVQGIASELWYHITMAKVLDVVLVEDSLDAKDLGMLVLGNFVPNV